MKFLMQFFTQRYARLTLSPEARLAERHLAYLSESSDLYELEFRMRKLDREAVQKRPSWMSMQN
jgi:hypothetical protein